MSLRARQQRALHRIEQTLAADDPRLGSMFAIFTRLTQHEAISMTERVRTRIRHLPHPVGVIPIAVIAALAVLVLSLLVPSPGTCSAPPAASRYGQAMSRTAACPPVRPKLR
jgi:hypothetical protein